MVVLLVLITTYVTQNLNVVNRLIHIRCYAHVVQNVRRG